VRPGVRLASGPRALNDGEVCQETQALHGTALNPANPHALGRCRYGPRQPLLGYAHGRSGIRSHAVTDQTSIMRFVEDSGLGGGDRVRVPSQEPFPLPCQIFSFDRDGSDDYRFLDLAAGEKLLPSVGRSFSTDKRGMRVFSHAPKSVIQIYLGKLNLIVT